MKNIIEIIFLLGKTNFVYDSFHHSPTINNDGIIISFKKEDFFLDLFIYNDRDDIEISIEKGIGIEFETIYEENNILLKDITLLFLQDKINIINDWKRPFINS